MKRKSVTASRTRDLLLSLARYGKITPDEAESEAKLNGWEAFELQPALPDYDPKRESRWSIVMAVAWIAWRDFQLVREQCVGYRSQARHWVHRRWNEAVDNGDAFTPRAGWFLVSWPEATTVRLSVIEKDLERKDQLPSTRQFSVTRAEEELWRALAQGSLVAEALNDEGRPVDIPQREWSYLKLYEDGKRDVLKYDALDRRDPYKDVKLMRDVILDLWPTISTYVAAQLDYGGPVGPGMIEPLCAAGGSGYVPLCCAIHWIMTDRGVRTAALDDEPSWQAAVDKLLPLIQSGEVELVGQQAIDPLTDRIPGHSLATIRVLHPHSRAISDILLEAGSHIHCSCYLGREEWQKNFNDCLYVTGRAKAAWTHLQVSKRQILEGWPRPESRLMPESDCLEWLLGLIRISPSAKSKTKEALLAEAMLRFPGLKERQFERAWSKALTDSGAAGWSKPGPIPSRSDHRGD